MAVFWVVAPSSGPGVLPAFDARPLVPEGEVVLQNFADATVQN
jgi:hypothetical protein